MKNNDRHNRRVIPKVHIQEVFHDLMTLNQSPQYVAHLLVAFTSEVALAADTLTLLNSSKIFLMQADTSSQTSSSAASKVVKSS
jgi:hypothetical protein